MSKRLEDPSRNLAYDFLKLSKSVASKAEELVNDLGLLVDPGDGGPNLEGCVRLARA